MSASEDMAENDLYLSLLPFVAGGYHRAMSRFRRAIKSGADCKNIVFLAAPQTQILDVAGPFQVFVRASEIFARNNPGKKPPYNVLLASIANRKAVLTNCGLVLTGTHTFRTLREPIDTLLVAGGSGVESASQSRELLQWLQRMSRRVRRFGSICTGAFVLASAGLLKGKRAATHWKWAPELAKRFAETSVDSDAIYVRDGNTFTTAGVTAGMDLALALVQDDLGSALALEVARELVLYLRRTGGQSQFSTALALQASDRQQIEDVRAWALDNLRQDLSVANLAAKARMSPRNFARVFQRETGVTPARFVERSRVEAARRRLEESHDKLEKIASDCGLHSIQGLRRSFQRHFHVPPAEYRHRFADLAAD